MFAKLKTWLAGSPTAAGPTLGALREQGDRCLAHGRFAEAEQCYRQALAAGATDSAELRVALGFALLDQSRGDEAELELRRALALDSANADAHYLLGRLWRQKGQPAQAVESFARALAANPAFEFAHRELFETLRQDGQTTAAREAVQRTLRAFPDSAEFHFHLADLLAELGELEQAVAAYQRSLALSPDSVASYINQASVLLKLNRDDEAAAAYRQALQRDGESFDAYMGLGSIGQRSGNVELALASYDQAQRIRPQSAVVQLNLGVVLEKAQRSAQAIGCFSRAVALDPVCASAHQGLGNAYLNQKRMPEALASFREVLRLQPDSPVKHLIAALTGEATACAPAAYIEKLFDQYAEHFDEHLVKVLDYKVPENLVQLLRSCHEAASSEVDVLDLGCGTGLFAVAMGQLAEQMPIRQLVGVDLSAQMLEKARARKLYSRLEQGDLLAMMREEPAESYDLVAATDVFVYIGELDGLFAETKRLLRPGGWFAFSVESLEALTAPADGPAAQDYRLNPTGRFAHSARYLEHLAATHDMRVLACREATSRQDNGRPIGGYLMIWLRPA